MIRIEPVGREREGMLFSLMQKYLYEMSRYYPMRMDEDGNYAYPYLAYYFTEAGRQAFLIYEADTLIGFALINIHSFTGEAIDNCIAEFTIFPAYRKRGCGLKAVEALMQARPGSWQLKYSLKNVSGAAFWGRVRDRYSGTETPLEDGEIALTIRA